MNELVDIAMIVGEQQPGLDSSPVGSRIVYEPAQGIVDPRRVEQRERPLAGMDELPVGGLVADGGERGYGEMAREFGRVGAVAGHFVAAFDHIRIGNFLRSDPDLDQRAIFRDERLELFEQIVAKVGRLGHRRRIDSALAEFGVGARGRRRRTVRLVDQAQFGIAEQGARFGRRRLAGLEEPFDRAAQRLRGGFIKIAQAIDGLFGRRDLLETASDVGDRLAQRAHPSNSARHALAAMQAISTA